MTADKSDNIGNKNNACVIYYRVRLSAFLNKLRLQGRAKCSHSVFVFYVFILGSTDIPNMVMSGAQLWV